MCMSRMCSAWNLSPLNSVASRCISCSLCSWVNLIEWCIVEIPPWTLGTRLFFPIRLMSVSSMNLFHTMLWLWFIREVTASHKKSFNSPLSSAHMPALECWVNLSDVSLKSCSLRKCSCSLQSKSRREECRLRPSWRTLWAVLSKIS